MLSLMKQRAARLHAEGEGDEGFTLIELLVVLLIIGILLAIAIPTFLSVTKSANDTAAQSNLQTALTTAKTYYTEQSQTYTGLYGGFAAIDSGLSEVSGGTLNAASTGPHVISVDAVNGNELVMTALASGTNNCWGILDVLSGVTGGVDGQSAAWTGTLYVEKANVATGACKPTLFTGTAKAGLSSTNGFSSVS